MDGWIGGDTRRLMIHPYTHLMAREIDNEPFRLSGVCLPQTRVPTLEGEVGESLPALLA